MINQLQATLRINLWIIYLDQTKAYIINLCLPFENCLKYWYKIYRVLANCLSSANFYTARKRSQTT
jgi:hypothetical protein